MFLNHIKLLLTILAVNQGHSITPIVIWHGIADTCCNPLSVGRAESNLREYLPGIHILSLQIGNSVIADYWNSLFMHPDKQIDIACNMIRADPLLAEGYNAIGFSQGSQFLRGLAQRCPEPRMKNLVTMAGQHQGVYGVPFCDAATVPLCNIFRRLLNQGAYSELFQRVLTPATYWHNPLSESSYVQGSTFLADINNEKSINQTYITNLQLLERLIMVKYEADKVVQPKESHWFGFYKPRSSRVVQSLQESELYTSDRLGLKQMDAEGKLHFLSNDWEHPDFEWDWFRENVVDKYLS